MESEGLSGDGVSVTVREDVPGGLMSQPIPGHMLQTVEKTPQVRGVRGGRVWRGGGMVMGGGREMVMGGGDDGGECMREGSTVYASVWSLYLLPGSCSCEGPASRLQWGFPPVS